MGKSGVFDYSFEANYSSTICSRLAKSIFFMSSSSDDLLSAMSAKTFGTAGLSKKNFAKPLSILRRNAEPNLNTYEPDKRQHVKFRKRLESTTVFEKGHMFEHEPHCPLFRVKQNSTIDDRSAVKEKKFLSFQINRNETNFQKFLRMPGPLNAKDLVDKYFDG